MFDESFESLSKDYRDIKLYNRILCYIYYSDFDIDIVNKNNTL